MCSWRTKLALIAALPVACDGTDAAPQAAFLGRPDAGTTPTTDATSAQIGSDAAGDAYVMSDASMDAPPDAPPSCPPPVAGSIEGTLAWGDVLQHRMASGVVASFPIVTPPDGKAAIVFTQGQQPSTPAGVTTELSISRCRGVIEPASSPCYQNTTFVNNNQIVAYTKPVNGWGDQATLGAQGCWAPETQGPFYVNVRWTYATCPFASCGFSLQWAFGPW